MAQYVPLTFLDGSKKEGGGEDTKMLIDGKTSTKWGQSFTPGTDMLCYIIFKTDEAVVPVNYFLCIGTDTNSYPTRNWDTWNIYGGNFASDEEAIRDAEGWVLIDSRESEILSTENRAFQDFKFNYDGQSGEHTTAYKYYWIEVIDNAQHGDVWTQMTEFGLGTSQEFKDYFDVPEAITYKVLDGTKMEGNESLPELFDGDPETKWGNGLTNRTNDNDLTNGAFFVVKSSKPICPAFYCLTTANDTGTYTGRNWKKWRIYAMNASSDDKATRESENWVLIDSKENIGTDLLPAANFTDCYFGLSEQVTTEYSYFKLELDQIVSNGDYMQMAEFAFGDAESWNTVLNKVYEEGANAYGPDTFAEEILLDEYARLLEAIKSATPQTFGAAKSALSEQANKVNASMTLYGNLKVAAMKAELAIEEKTIDAEATEYLSKYLNEVIAPCEDYPVGTYAYIKENRQLTGEEAETEAKRINAYLLTHNSVQVDPIYATYEALDGSGGFGGEEHDKLIDGDPENTKWCTSTQGIFVIFKSSEPIKPTYYGLVTGGDTYTYPSRNWKNWDIYAANFDSDEEATRDAEGWVLIDHKVNVGTDVLKTYNKYESYIDLSEPVRENYSYFKIEVHNTELVQMNEFTFYNQGNFNEYREGFLDQVNDSVELAGFETIDESLMAYKPLIDEYLAAYESLRTATDAPSLTKYRNRLLELITEIRISNETYTEYAESVEAMDANVYAEYEQASAWAEGYFSDEAIEPGVKYVRGNAKYILENRPLDNEGITAELEYLTSMELAASDPDEAGYIVLGGHTVGQWGDGHYKHIVDNHRNADGELDTKWGGSASAEGDTYVIFRTIEAVNPYFYTLTTGGDTYSYQGRNWKTWEIYGANFEGDGAATKDAEGWVLVDKKENIGQDRLHPENLTASYFGFSTETTEKYLYYKVVVYSAYEGNSVQMQELRFGTEEEFDAIKGEYTTAANEFDLDVIAEQALIDNYKETVLEIDDAANMEALFRVNYEIEQLQKSITASAKVYGLFSGNVDEVKQYLEENNLEESEALATLKSYIGEEEIEPNETFFNGSAEYILENHVLADSIVTEEIEFLEALKKAAVTAGYVAGTDISSMIVNRSFAKAEQVLDDDGNNVSGTRKPEGWDGYLYTNETNEAGTMSAAEFCNEQSTFNISQTLKGLKNGYYEVKLNAGFRPNGDINSFNYAAMAFANNTKTFVPAVREGMVEEENAWTGVHADKPIYACDVQEPTQDPEVDSVVVGYVIWGVQGTINAILQDRYEITMVAKVTNGTLKIGLKNEGTTVGGDWLGAGNFRLKYLGEEATAEAIAAAAESNGARAAILTETYVCGDPNEASAFKVAPNFGATQKAALESFASSSTVEQLIEDGNLFEEIYATKAAYYNLCVYKDAVYNKWINHPTNREDVDLEDDIYDIVENLDAGLYDDAAAAKKALRELLAIYPDYLEFGTESGESKNVDFEEGEDYYHAFEYTIEADGKTPYVYLKSFYDALNEDEVLLTFDYKSEEDIEDGILYFGTPAFDQNRTIELPTLTAAADWTTVTIDITQAVKEWGFGKTDHVIRWNITSRADELEMSVRRFIVTAKAGPNGDLNGDGYVDPSDIQVILNDMAEDITDPAKDLNNDGFVDPSDIQVILNIMAEM
jgi:hypothetical protein